MASWDEDEADLEDHELPDSADLDESDSDDDSKGDSDDDSTCPECGAAIYHDVEVCPRCGYAIPAITGNNRKPLWIVVGATVCLLIVLLLWKG